MEWEDIDNTDAVTEIEQYMHLSIAHGEYL